MASLFYLDVNVALIRGTTADENGNITTEHEAANFEILPLATAVRKQSGGIVIAQVENIAEVGAGKAGNTFEYLESW